MMPTIMVWRIHPDAVIDHARLNGVLDPQPSSIRYYAKDLFLVADACSRKDTRNGHHRIMSRRLARPIVLVVVRGRQIDTGSKITS